MLEQQQMMSGALGTQDQLQQAHAQLKEAHQQQALQMQRLQEDAKRFEEAKKLEEARSARYRAAAKKQEAIIHRFETLMGQAAKKLESKKAEVGRARRTDRTTHHCPLLLRCDPSRKGAPHPVLLAPCFSCRAPLTSLRPAAVGRASSSRRRQSAPCTPLW